MESINLNLIPQGANPVVHAKQFDEGRGFRFNLFNGTAPIVLTGAETITCNVKKPDGNLVTVAVTNTSSNYVEVYTTLQMCACYGANLGEIRLEEDGNDIGTLNFTLSVEESPLNNGIESESSIHNLNTMVDEMVAEEVATQYDSANVIFDNEPTDNHGIGYTVTSEGIKTAIDNAFDYDNTASGSLVHITDGADNIPVKSLASEIVAVESGNGQPKSPTNPYTISGWSDCLLAVTDNTDLQYISGLLKGTYDCADLTSLTWTYNSGNGFLNSTKDLPNAVQTFGGVPNAISGIDLPLVDASQLGNVEKGWTIYNRRFYLKNTALSEADLRSLLVGNYVVYKTVSTIKPTVTKTVLDGILTSFGINGNTYTFAFGQTVYGGYFDNKGNLVVTKIAHIFDGSESFISLESGTVFAYDFGANMLVNSQVAQGKSLSTHFIEVDSGFGWNSVTSGKFLVAGNRYFGCNPNMSLADYKTFLTNQYQANTPVKAICLLANPITLSITSQDIPTLLGENNIFSNCGDVKVDYYTNKAKDILEFINTEIGKKNGDNIPIEANSPDSIKDYIDNVSLSGLSDTDISSASAGQVLTFDGDNWVNSNIVLPSIKYEEIDVTLDSSGEGTLFDSVKFVVGLKDIPSDSLYVGYVSYIVASRTMVKAFSRSAIAFSSQNNVSSTRKVGVYYLDNIATQ